MSEIGHFPRSLLKDTSGQLDRAVSVLNAGGSMDTQVGSDIHAGGCEVSLEPHVCWRRAWMREKADSISFQSEREKIPCVQT